MDRKISMNQEKWFDLRNEARWIRDLFGVPEGWSSTISWGPERAGERKMEQNRVVAHVYATHAAHDACIDVCLTADGERTVTVRSRGRVTTKVPYLAGAIAHLQAGGRDFAG